MSSLASLIVLQGANRGARYQLLPDRNRIGRDPGLELPLSDEAASRLHAEVIWNPEQERYLLRDLESRNGTQLNGLPCGENPLQAGDELRIGETVLLFQPGDDAPPGRSGGSTLILPGEPAATEGSSPASLVLERAPQLVGRSPAFLSVLGAAARCAVTDSPVLILGESGTGKELLAQAVHRTSPRRSGPLVCVNAANLSDSLCASELFGHERGAFTGAAARRAGCLERAHQGSLFLDEVGDLPLETQGKLLRALETKRFTRLGGNEELESDLRLIAATNRDLDERVKQGSFRQDLLFRLDVVRLELPPLRERPGDVELLAEYFVAELASKMPTPVRALGAQAHVALQAYGWPGNVRELRNVLERALIFANGAELSVQDLPANVTGAAGTERASGQGNVQSVRPLLELERAEIGRALAATEGNKTQAALLLGIDRKTLYAKMDRHGLER